MGVSGVNRDGAVGRQPGQHTPANRHLTLSYLASPVFWMLDPLLRTLGDGRLQPIGTANSWPNALADDGFAGSAEWADNSDTQSPRF